jgi:hypothetical protein
MKTKTMTGRFWRTGMAVGLVLAGLLAARQQASGGVVGYVNVPLTNGYNFIANPLDDGRNNTLTNVLFGLPTGSRAYFWDMTNQVFLPRATRLGSGWNRNYDMSVGRGVIVYVPTRYTNTFVGNLLPGYLTNVVAGNNQLSLLGCMLPVGGPLSVVTNGPGFPRIDGATAHFFRTASQSFSEGYTCYTNYGWFDPKGIESTNGPNLGVGESFFIQNPGPPTNWVRIYTNEMVVGKQAMRASAISLLEVQQLFVQGGSVTLKISNPGGAAYEVQFSTDGAAWTTVAANQSGTTWTGPLPDPVRGCFQVITSITEGGAK